MAGMGTYKFSRVNLIRYC